MSILTLVYPAQAVVSIAQTFFGSFAVTLRSILGIGILGIVAVFAVVFKPLIIGFTRTLQLVIQPSVPAQQRRLLRRLKGVQLLSQLAKEADVTQPNLAAEMRHLAARG